MNLKKVAMLVLMFMLVSVFSLKSVSALANETTTCENAGNKVTVVNNTIATASSVSNVTVKEKVTEKKKATAKAAVKKYKKSELRLMASIINCEAGSEPYQGKLAVGIVIMNRVSSRSFPGTIKNVVYQSGQFSPVRNGSLKKRLAQYDSGRTGSKQWKSCISAAKKVLNGQRTIIYRGKTKNMSGFHFFSVSLPGARLRLGGHRFK